MSKRARTRRTFGLAGRKTENFRRHGALLRRGDKSVQVRFWGRDRVNGKVYRVDLWHVEIFIWYGGVYLLYVRVFDKCTGQFLRFMSEFKSDVLWFRPNNLMWKNKRKRNVLLFTLFHFFINRNVNKIEKWKLYWTKMCFFTLQIKGWFYT